MQAVHAPMDRKAMQQPLQLPSCERNRDNVTDIASLGWPLLPSVILAQGDAS